MSKSRFQIDRKLSQILQNFQFVQKKKTKNLLGFETTN